MTNHQCKDTSPEEYRKIKEDHGVEYIRAYHEALAAKNGLEGSYLYVKLSAYPKVAGDNYLVAVLDKDFKCVHVGYTESPFSYWVNLLKDNRYGKVKDIVVLESGLETKVGSKRARELKQDLQHLTRKLRISYALGE